MNYVMKKRGQVTAFIIIAIIILAVTIAFFMFNKESSKSGLEMSFSKLGINAQASEIHYSVLDCLSLTSKDALDIIGIQGGFYNAPEKSFDLGWAFIPYYYDNGNLLMPSKETIEKELGKYVDDNLNYCIETISTEEFSIAAKQSKTTSRIKEKEVEFKIDSTVSISKADQTAEYKLETTPVLIESSLSDILEVADYITSSHKEDPEMICISCVSEMAKERNLYVDMIDFGEDSTLVVLSENYTSFEPYIFEFLNKYPEE